MLKGYSAIVTGSTSGIGLAVAHELAKQGADLMINGFGDADAIEKERVELESKYGIRCVYSGADLSKADACEKLVKDAIETFGKVDILVNNAGIQYVAPIEEFPTAKWDAIIAINLSACFHTMKAAITSMQKNDFGRIINIASAHGLVASPEKTGYVAAKHGLVGLTKVVALENAEANITCNSVCPGWVETPLVQKQVQDRADENGTSYEEEAKLLVGEKQPNKRFASPESIGKAVVYLADPDNKYTTGSELSVDGGWLAK